MARYIDADKFAKEICELPAIDEHSANAVIFLLYKQPTADVVEVVRCEECRSASKRFACYKCRVTGERHNGGHYCSYGKRRDK